jgi:hypothetical protein
MESELDSTMFLIESLRMESSLCVSRLENAGKLIHLLADEGKRWEETIAQLQEQG